MTDKEKLRIVNDFEAYVYDNNAKNLDRSLSFIYNATNNPDGWDDVQKRDLENFERAYKLALDNIALFE